MTFDLASLGWDADFASAYAELTHGAPPRRSGAALSGYRPARVARVDRGVCTIFTADGADRASLGGDWLARCARDPVWLPCAGDWLAVRTWPDRRTTIEAVLPRRTRILRATAGRDSRGQVLAANLDVAAVVEPMAPAPDLAQIERLLALAISSGARPLVLLTKADLLARPEPVARQVAEATGGVEVITVSAQRGTGLDRLRPLVAAGRTLGLLGPSGSGKSTLVNALAGAPVMGTRSIRRSDGRGRHTTTYRVLVPLPGGGAVLDTPGVRAVGLFDSEPGLRQVFAEIDRLAEGCRFADCDHDLEPGCAVREALATGELTARRLDSWRRLRRELDGQSRRRDARLAVESGAEWRRRQRQGRAAGRVGHLPG
ncbi:ribosome small subunit-dependent GTPase A [Rugosimonospora acidiphila]|uniref:Small ribosomal subunit biogenesis GTPase RsgA n=1 Tax=Rugosimonospora acidiphila TaxID=556531 RepID=A0ABP9S8X1_9ACTN